MRHGHPLPGWHHLLNCGFGKNSKTNPGKTLRMNSSWKPTNNSGVLLILRVTGWWMRWDGGKGGDPSPVEVCCSVLLAPLPLPSCLTWAGKPVRVQGASRLHSGHFGHMLFKGSFILLEHPRTTGCSLPGGLPNRLRGGP